MVLSRVKIFIVFRPRDPTKCKPAGEISVDIAPAVLFVLPA
jgi:hypothetical protein